MKKLILGMILIPLFSYGQLNPITIEASALSEDTPEVSPSVTVLDARDLEKYKGNTVAEVLQSIPGLDVVSQGAVGQVTSVFIRGARSEDTLVLVDGIVVNDVMAPSAGFDFANLSSVNIERIEVYRGPQTVRFGNGSLGGVINIITKEGRGPLEAKYFIEGGSYNTRRAVLGISGKSNQLGYSLGLDGLQTSGFSSADKNLGNKEDDGAKLLSASGKISWTPQENTSVTGTLRYTQTESDRDNGGGPTGDDPNATAIFKQTTAGILGSQRFFDKKLRSTLSYSFSEVKRDDNNPSDTANPDSATNDFLSESQKIETVQDWSVTSFQNLKLILSHSQASGTSTSTFNGTPTLFPRKEQITWAEALSYNLDNTRWIFDAGLRGDQQQDKDNATSTRISIGRRLFGEKTILRMTYGTGFKHPSLFQLFSNYGTTTLESESSQSFDLSWEQSLVSSLKVTMDYFRNTYKHLIDFDTATSKYMNVAAADSDGIEVQGQFEPVSGNGVRTVYTYLHTHDGATGQRLLRRAQNSVSLLAYMQVQKFSGSAQYRYVGDREDIDPVSYARVKNPSYDVVHLQANYQVRESCKISMRIQNLLDRQYEEIIGYGTAGRSFYIGLSN